MSRAHARMARPRRRADQTMAILLVAFVIAACITSILAVLWARNLIQSRSRSEATVQGESSSDTVGEEVNVPAPVGPLQRGNRPTPVPWDGKSRVTILFMGLDYRDWTEGTDIPRTDSMILFSIDPASKTAGMLSIPRDTWVNVPGMGYNKINTAYRWGEVYSVPGGGPALAMQTVEEFLGMPVDFYALVDFNAFVRLIDEMGGLDMHIREEIVVDPIGPGNTITLQPGVQTLDGATVLAYARQRHTGNDDFDRSRRQQEVIMAIREQVLQFNMLPTLISKAPRMYHEISEGVSTNLTLDQIIRLALIGAQIDEKRINKGVISPPDQVMISTNPEDGQSILVPVPDQIRILRDEVFAGSEINTPPVAAESPRAAAETASPTLDLEQMMKREKARVIVQNGTSVPGLAANTGQLLKSMGLNVVQEDNADTAFFVTTVYDYTGKPNTVRFLIEKLNLPDARIENRYDPNAPADIVLILGADWANQQ